MTFRSKMHYKISIFNCTVNIRFIDNVTFEGAMDSSQTIELKNYYLEKFFGENVLFNAGVFISLILLFIMFGVAII